MTNSYRSRALRTCLALLGPAAYGKPDSPPTPSTSEQIRDAFRSVRDDEEISRAEQTERYFE